MNMIGILFILIFAVGMVSAQERSDKATRDAKTEEEIKKLEQEWVEAYQKRDTAFLERILADDYTFTTPGGTILDKKRQIEDLKSGAIATEFQFSELKVRVYADTAIVTGKSTVKGKLKDQNIAGEYRFMRVFVKRDDRWQCVAAQATRIAQP
jgi:uncharacterized protein (TIGR02246 family)